MSHIQRTAAWPVLVIGILSVGTWALINGRPRALPAPVEKNLTRVPRHQAETPAQAADQVSQSSAPIQNSAAANKDESKVTALPIMLKPGGFVPMEITGPAGDYFFSVGNQSGLRDVAFSLDRERGARIKEAQIKNDRLRWRQMVKLTPGTYLLTEASHPKWVCRIRITER